MTTVCLDLNLYAGLPRIQGSLLAADRSPDCKPEVDLVSASPRSSDPLGPKAATLHLDQTGRPPKL
eukprot:3489763-Amphidinium_carterae.1